MKKLVFLVTTALLVNGVPAFARETPQEQYLCKLQSGNCLSRADVIQRKMKKLNADMKTGKKVYSASELQKIEDKLKEVERMLDNLKAK